MKTIEISLPFPPSANRYWRSAPKKGLVPSEEATAYKRKVAAVARGVMPLVGPVTVRLTAFRPRRVGDLDNLLKVLFDACREVLFLDDDQVLRIEADREDDAANPRVELRCTGERIATVVELAEAKRKRIEATRKRRKTRRLNARARAMERAKPAVYGRAK